MQIDWPDLLPRAVLAHNMTPHAQTGLSPFNLMLGRRTNSSLLVEDEHQDRDFKNFEFQRLRNMYEKIRKDKLEQYTKPTLIPGGLLWLFRPAAANDCPKKFHSPWTMTNVTQQGRTNYVVRDASDKEFPVHSNHLKPVMKLQESRKSFTYWS
jgi:hypothetical protein